MLAGVAFWGYTAVVGDNVVNHPDGKHEFYIHTGWNYDSLELHLKPLLKESLWFDKLAGRMNLKNRVIPGKYVIRNGMSNLVLIRLLRSGAHEQVKVQLKGSSKRGEILGELGIKLEPDSLDFKRFIDTSSMMRSLGYNRENWPCIMMANTYYFNWATSTQSVFERFENEKTKFWTKERKSKLKSLGLSQNQALILASIVDAESMHDSELERIAGVYMNRLQKDWPLQADPTIKMIALAEGRQRVLKSDLKVQSPYNTYLNKGLPPGPVLVPSEKAIDGVLNAENHEYMFFCAKDDLSGYHLFTASGTEHINNANRYHKALDARNIKE